MADANFPKRQPLASEMIKGKGTTYFIDVRLTKTDKPYLCICTSRKRKGEEKSERACIFIFQDDILDFLEGLKQITPKTEKILAS